MGQYWFAANIDKKEFLHAHKMGSGLKLIEQLWAWPGPQTALLWLLHDRWSGDRVAVAGDNNAKDERLYAELDDETGSWTDISEEVVTELGEELGMMLIPDRWTWGTWEPLPEEVKPILFPEYYRRI